MASSLTPQGSVRQRNVPGSGKKNKDGALSDVEVEKVIVKKPSASKLVAKHAAAKPAAQASERDYQIVGFFITAAAFLTRFWGISHPNEVVFDEVHFGKVRIFQQPLLRWPNTNTGFAPPVRLVLPPKNLLLRCPPPSGQALVCLYGLAGGL